MVYPSHATTDVFDCKNILILEGVDINDQLFGTFLSDIGTSRVAKELSESTTFNEERIPFQQL